VLGDPTLFNAEEVINASGYARSVQQSSQLAVKKFARPTVGKVSRGGVVVFSVMAGEGMTLTRIAVDRRVWFLSKCRFNLRLCSLGNELILLGQVHEKGRMKPIDLSQIFLSIGTVIPDRGVDAVVAHGCHEDHQRAEAIAEQGNLARAFRQTATASRVSLMSLTPASRS
jgi:hypothetical protein